MSETEPQTATEGATKPRWTSQQKLVVALLAVAALGCLLPWARVFFIEVSGLDVGDGQLFAVGLVVTALLTWRVAFKQASVRFAVAARVAAVALAALGSFAFGEIAGTDVASPGAGLFLSAGSAIALAVVLLRQIDSPRRSLALGVSAALVVAALVAGNSAAEDLGDPFDMDVSTSGEDAVRASVGEAVELDGAVVTVTNIRGGHARDFMDEPTDERVIIFDVEVVNTGDEDEWFDSSDFQVETPSGTIESAAYSSRASSLDANLAPGGEATGTVEFPHVGPGVYVLRYTPLFEPLLTLRVKIDE